MDPAITMSVKETILMAGVAGFVYSVPVAVAVSFGASYYVYSGCMALRAWHRQ